MKVPLNSCFPSEEKQIRLRYCFYLILLSLYLRYQQSDSHYSSQVNSASRLSMNVTRRNTVRLQACDSQRMTFTQYLYPSRRCSCSCAFAFIYRPQSVTHHLRLFSQHTYQNNISKIGSTQLSFKRYIFPHSTFHPCSKSPSQSPVLLACSSPPWRYPRGVA